MKITFQTTIDDNGAIDIYLPKWESKASIVEKKIFENQPGSFYIFIRQRQIVGMDVQPTFLEDHDTLVNISFPRELKESDILDGLLHHKRVTKDVQEYIDTIYLILHTFGYDEHTATPKKKAVHTWSKSVSDIEFHTTHADTKGTVLWQKRNVVLLKKGAKLLPNAPLNKDGSESYSSKYGDKLREDYKNCIQNFTTTKDIQLKSMNEVGLFLYYGGTNSWLVFVDASGKTMEEYTVKS